MMFNNKTFWSAIAAIQWAKKTITLFKIRYAI